MLHLLIHMAHAGRPLTSEELARMLKTNPVLVRRTLAGLRERGLVSAEKGHGGGWIISRPLEAITLYDVYEALGEPSLFAIGHRSEQSRCLVEQAVNASLDRTLEDAEALILGQLRAVTLAALTEGLPRQALVPTPPQGGNMQHPSDAEFWDRKYLQHPSPAAGESGPNPVLAHEIADQPPGTALDLGCGEGADALWLAQRGWNVTAVDISTVALERGRAADAARQVDWVQADMLVWQPPADAYDLISLHYVHIPPVERAALFGRLAAATRREGTLLVVAHHPSDHETTVGRPAIPDLYFTADDVAAALVPGRWELLFSGTRPRRVTDRQGRALTIQDAVLKARRID